ncbi:MAG: methyltransferase [Clostridiales bacterium]|nr:methyltransferase [Clostridiales bacterium]
MRTVDDLQVNGLTFVQDTSLFRFGTDAVALANFAIGAKGKNVCDLCAGSGIVGVLLAGKYGCRVTAVEIQEECCALIEENAARNGLPITAVHMRLQEFEGHFDAVTCNPPYRKTGSGFPRASKAEKIACTEECVTFGEVADCAARLLSDGGKFYLVQHIERLCEVIATCKERRLEPKVLQILRPNKGKKPHLFLLECLKGGKEGVTVLPEKDVE